MKHLLFALAALALLGTGGARADEREAGRERDRIKAERQAAEARYAAEQQACGAHFAVNDCIDAARRQRRDTLSALRRQEIAINDAERKRRAAERLREIDAAAQRDAAAAARQAEAREDRRQREQRHDAKAARQQARMERSVQEPPRAHEPKSPLGRQPSADESAANRREHEARVRDAKERKDKLEARRAERAKPPASALPVPP